MQRRALRYRCLVSEYNEKAAADANKIAKRAERREKRLAILLEEKNIPLARKHVHGGLSIVRHLAARNLGRLISVQKLRPFRCMHRFGT